MTTLIDLIIARLTTATASILTGGWFKSDDIDIPSGGGWQWAKDQGLVSNLTLASHGILRMKDSTQYDVRHIGGEMQTFEFFMYAEYGQYAVLESAIKPIKDAFPYNEIVTVDNRQLVKFLFEGAYGEMPAEEYQMRPSRFVRYEIIQVR